MDRQDPMGIGEEGLEMPESPDLMLGMSKSREASPKLGSRHSRKNSGAPKRFKSMAKHKEIKTQLQKEGAAPKSTNITKTVAEAWRSLTPREKAKYEDMANEDKARYAVEKANYREEKKGNIITGKKKQRDPTAPKRPMSAFLAFANSRRAEVKALNPDSSNGEISKILSNKWKDAEESLKQKYRDEEAAKWAAYREHMVDYRKKNDGRKRESKALEAAAALKGKRKKKKKKSSSKSKNFEEEPSIADNSFDDPHFGGFGTGGLESSTANTGTNHDDIMAASAALRGVRSGPSALQFGVGVNSSAGGMGGGGAGLVGLDSSMQQSLQQGSGGYGALFGMNTMNSFGVGMSGSAGNSVGGAGGFGQEMGNSSANRALLEMGFPYQQYGSYAGVLGNNSQAMLMAQAALRGNPGAYLGLTDQQPPLSQLASLAGSQNGSGALGQSQMSMGIGFGLGGMGGMGGMSGMGGMGGLMNDNSNNRLGSDSMMNNAF